MDRTGTPVFLCLEALKYTFYLLNHTICQSLDAISMQILTGSTPDISALLQFHWYQCVYCVEDDTSFPSDSCEISERFIGSADHVGHKLTYTILTDDIQCIIHRSRVCTAEDPKTINIRADKWEESQEQHEFIHTCIDDKPNDEDQFNANNQMSIINTEDLIGRTYPIINHNGNEDKITIVDVLNKHKEDTLSDPSHIEFTIKHTLDDCKEIIAYNDIINAIQDYGENNALWEFKIIKAHQGPLSSNHPDYKGSSYNITLELENGETIDEPLSIMAIDAPIACVKYGLKNNLLHMDG